MDFRQTFHRLALVRHRKWIEDNCVSDGTDNLTPMDHLLYANKCLVIQPIVKLLIVRDSISEEEAINLILECIVECNERDPEEVIQEILGLEPDFLLDLLY